MLGLYRDNGKENGNYYLGLYRDNGKENGNYYLELYRDYKGIMLGSLFELTSLVCI